MTARTVETTWRTDGSEASDEHSIAVAVMEAIGELRDDWSRENEITLYNYIDPEALDLMLAHSGSNSKTNWEVQFDINEYTVTITSDGQITVN